MAKRTAVIDIGSNSARMVVFERTSRFGFHLLNETKSRVRLGEGAYENGGFLQPIPMARAMEALKGFMRIAHHYRARKILCVATSAMRDAPNAKVFCKEIERTIGLKIKIIEGKKEAHLGGIAVANLLPITDAITIDIGGGSTELALIRQKKVIESYSLNLGTVRLKELFYDKKRPIDEAIAMIQETLQVLPKTFKDSLVIGIGGTIRALSKGIMQESDHVIERVHGFRFKVKTWQPWIETIARSTPLALKNYPIKKERYDTIRPGALIFATLLRHLKAKEVVASGAGVREGLFLSDLLRHQNHLFPSNFNPSVRSLTDRFCCYPKLSNRIAATAHTLFEALQTPYRLPQKMARYVAIAAKLSQLGIALNFYDSHKHSAYFILHALEYGFWHEEMILIATLIRFHKKRLPTERFIKPYKNLLPNERILAWLSYIVSLAQTIHLDRSLSPIACEYRSGVLTIEAPFSLHLAKERAKTLQKPAPLALYFFEKA